MEDHELNEVVRYVPGLLSHSGDLYFDYLSKYWDRYYGIMDERTKKIRDKKYEPPSFKELPQLFVVSDSKHDRTGAVYLQVLSDNWNLITREKMFQTPSTFNGKIIDFAQTLREGMTGGLLDVSITPWVRKEGGLGPSSDDPPPPPLSLKVQLEKIGKVAKRVSSCQVFGYLKAFVLRMKISNKRFDSLVEGRNLVTKEDEETLSVALEDIGLDVTTTESDNYKDQFQWITQLVDIVNTKAFKKRIESSTHFLSFLEAHNRNVTLFQSILDNEQQYTPKYPTWTHLEYSNRLGSDIILKESLRLRELIEEMVPNLMARASIQNDKETDILPPYFNPSLFIPTKKITDFRIKKWSKNFDDLPVTTAIEDIPATTVDDESYIIQAGRSRWLINSGEVKLSENISGSPVASKPAPAPTNLLSPKQAIQWAFAVNRSKFPSDHYTISKNGRCYMICDFNKMVITVTCEPSKGLKLSKDIPLPPIFKQALPGPSSSSSSSQKTGGVGALSISDKDKEMDSQLQLMLLDIKEYERKEEEKVAKMQIHSAMEFGVSAEDLIQIIVDNPDCAAIKNLEHKLPLQRAVELKLHTDVIAQLLLHSLPFKRDGTPQDFPGEGACWILILTETNDLYVDAVNYVLAEFLRAAENNVDALEHVRELSEIRDVMGRKAIDVATPKCKRAIMSSLLFYARYEFKQRHPEHQSATCILHIADDHDCDHQLVALKIMKNKDQYLRELESRKSANFDPDYIIGVLRGYDGDEDASIASELTRKGYVGYKYCLVLPAAERNLANILAHEHIAGRDWKKIRQIGEELAEAIRHMHSNGIIHGDIKPLNIVRESQRIKLIDLDACAQLKDGYSGCKFSSAYLPPELLYCNGGAEDKVTIRTFNVDQITGLPDTQARSYTLVRASTAHDSWSLGVTLFQMCTGEPLFLANDEDNVDDRNLRSIWEWADDLKNDKLLKVKDPKARNLLGQLLNKDPNKRPNMLQVINHPFISGKQTARMVGEEAEFDVFISYRVNSDAHHVEKLYDLLTSRGIKVWWDRKCLKPGMPWEEGFCQGLVKSSSFVPLMSRKAIRNPDVTYQNFECLTEGSSCDNVFLEYRLALELRDMGFINQIYPVMIGDCSADDHSYGSYFPSCHPRGPEVTVRSVELKLREHLDSQGLGAPICTNTTVKTVLEGLTKNQGGFIRGDGESSFAAVADTIADMLIASKTRKKSVDLSASSSPRAAGGTSPRSAGSGRNGVRAALETKNLELLDHIKKLEIELEMHRSLISSSEGIVTVNGVKICRRCEATLF